MKNQFQEGFGTASTDGLMGAPTQIERDEVHAENGTFLYLLPADITASGIAAQASDLSQLQ